MSTKASYLYGVVPTDGEKSFGPIGLDGGDVHTVSDDGIGIVASESDHIRFPEIPPDTTLRYLAQHQRVLEQVMRDSPVIPLKFGTYADDNRHILEILHSGRSEFAGALEKYAGKLEVDLAAFWTDMNFVLAEIARDESVISMKAQIGNQAGATMEQRVRLGQLVKKRLDERRDQIANRLLVALRVNWSQMVVNPIQDDAMIVNAAVLIGREEQAKLEHVVEQLDHSYENRLHFRCVGPLPPYSFATAEVKTIGASRLDAARRLLELGESTSLANTKAAYRRLLQEAHPDRNPGAQGGDRIQEISDAYELLEEYALNFKHTFNAAQNAPVIVKIRSLDDLRAGTRVPRRGDQMKRPGYVGVEAA